MSDLACDIQDMEGYLNTDCVGYPSLGFDRHVFSLEFFANYVQHRQSLVHRQSMQLEHIMKRVEDNLGTEEACAVLLDISSDLTQHAIIQSEEEDDRSASLHDRRILIIGEEVGASFYYFSPPKIYSSEQQSMYRHDISV